MNTKTATYISRAAGSLAAALLLALPGCVADQGLCPEDLPEYADAPSVWLSLQVGVPEKPGAPATRADGGDAAGHPEEAHDYDEKFIDKDGAWQLLLFDNNQRLLKVMERDELSFIWDESTNTGSVTARINTAWFNYDLDSEAVDCHLLLVANMTGATPATGAADRFSSDSFAKHVSDLPLCGFDFTGSPSAGANADPWKPSVADKQLIPMSGMARMTLPRTAIANGTDKEHATQGGKIMLLRTLAKLRVVDNLKSDFEPDARIVKVEILGGNTRGSFLPDLKANKRWPEATHDVEQSAAPASWFSTTARAEMAQGPDAYGKTLFTAYVPEYDLDTAPGDLTLRIHYRTDGTQASETFRDFKWSEIMGPDNAVIARNHIYEITAKRPDAWRLTLDLTVRQWDEGNVNNLDYTGTPGIKDFDYLNKVRPAADGVTLNLANDTAHPAGFKFTVDTPREGRWKASLNPLYGPLGSIVFCDAEGNIRPEAPGGIIDGSPTELYVRPLDATTPGQTNGAELIIMIEAPDGTMTELDLVPDKPGKRFRLHMSTV